MKLVEVCKEVNLFEWCVHTMLILESKNARCALLVQIQGYLLYGSTIVAAVGFIGGARYCSATHSFDRSSVNFR